METFKLRVNLIRFDGMTHTLERCWIKPVERQSTVPMMSQAKLEQTLPLIQNAAKALVKDMIESDLEYDSRDISSAYTIKAIMASGFGIGKHSSNPELGHNLPI